MSIDEFYTEVRQNALTGRNSRCAPSPIIGFRVDWNNMYEELTHNIRSEIKLPFALPLYGIKGNPSFRAYGVQLNEFRACNAKDVESAILFVILRTKFEKSEDVVRGRYTINFKKFPAWFLRTLVGQILTTTEERINYSWLEPLQTLLLEAEDKERNSMRRHARRRKRQFLSEENGIPAVLPYNEPIDDNFDENVPIHDEEELHYTPPKPKKQKYHTSWGPYDGDEPTFVPPDFPIEKTKAAIKQKQKHHNTVDPLSGNVVTGSATTGTIPAVDYFTWKSQNVTVKEKPSDLKKYKNDYSNLYTKTLEEMVDEAMKVQLSLDNTDKTLNF